MVAIDKSDNELITLEIIHRLVSLLDKFFENVCELDIVYNFDKVYWILDELLMAGELQEPSMNEVLRHVDYPEQQERAELISTFI